MKYYLSAAAVSSLIIFLIFLLTFCCKSYETFTSPKDYSDLLNDDVLVLTYENEALDRTETRNLIRLLTKLDYPYIKIVGENETWNGWSGRARSYLAFLKSLKNKNSFICVCDGRDVLPNTTYTNFQNILKQRYNGTIIFGAENFCCTGFLDEPENKEQHKKQMIEIKNAKSSTDTDAYFLNFGLAFGKVNDFINLFESFDLNKKDFDDQAEASMMYTKGSFELDYDEILGCNVINRDGNPCIEKFSSVSLPYILSLQRNQRNITPCFIHFPGENNCYQPVVDKINNNL